MDLAITVLEVIGELGLDATDVADLYPGEAAIGRWIEEFTAAVALELKAIGIESVSGDLYKRVRGGVIDAVVGRWHAKNQRDNTELAVAAAEEWRQWIEDLRLVRGFATGGAQTPEGRSSVTPRVTAARKKTVWERSRGFN